MKLSVLGKLPVPITILKNNKAVACTQVQVSDLTTLELFKARQQAKDGEFWLLYEMAAKTELIDPDGAFHTLTYEQLTQCSSANFKALEALEFDLTLKLEAESLSVPSN